MHIALCIAHAWWSPHRSGYEYAHPSAAPDEYAISRAVACSVASLLDDTPHTIDIIEKSRAFACGSICDGEPCGKYAAALVAQTKAASGADLVIECHCNYGPPGRNGALVLCTDSARALQFAATWLANWVAAAPLAIAGRGVYSPPDADVLFGRKWLLSHGGPHVVMLELGYASSATDSAYLQQPRAAEACAAAIVAAIGAP